jgi:LacI family transcriptional regulator
MVGVLAVEVTRVNRLCCLHCSFTQKSKGGLKVVTIKDVAEIAKVSHATVSYVLNNSKKPIKPETRQRVLDAAKKAGYYPNLTARALKTKVSNTIGIIIMTPNGYQEAGSFFVDPFVSTVIAGVGSVAQSAGYSILVSFCDGVKETIVQTYRQKMIDGAIILGNRIQDPMVEEATKEGFPMVLFEDDGIARPNVSSLKCNHKAVMVQAVEYLVRLGHRQIAYVSGGLEIPSGRERLDGFQIGLRKHGIEFPAEYLYEGAFTEDTGFEAAIVFSKLEHTPTSVCCASDRITIGLMKGFQRFGFKIPEQISVIGYDDIEMSKYLDPALTTIKLLYYDMAQTGAKLLLKMLTDHSFTGECVEFEGELCIRRSCAHVG